jgi:hypothetical protein
MSADEGDGAPEDRPSGPRLSGASERPGLRPARPDASKDEPRASYMPRLPWLWIILGAIVIGASVGGFYLRREQRADALRADILSLHDDRLSDLSERYLGFRDRIETLVHRAARGPAPERWADEHLNLSGLRSGEGLYLRIPARVARDRENISAGALGMTPDSITRCMGLAPMSVRGLYERGDFLTPEWIDRVRGENDMMRLRVLDDQLGRHVQVDAPVVVNMMRADWFLLVIQQGENRRDHPVDVYLWGLRGGENKPLLRARIQGRGLLIPVRVRLPGTDAPDVPSRAPVQSGGAQDCSIASQIREVAGGESIEFESGQQLLERENAAPSQPAPSDEEAPQD